MDDCVFALPAFMVLYIVFVSLGCCPVTGAVALSVTYMSLASVN